MFIWPEKKKTPYKNFAVTRTTVWKVCMKCLLGTRRIQRISSESKWIAKNISDTFPDRNLWILMCIRLYIMQPVSAGVAILPMLFWIWFLSSALSWSFTTTHCWDSMCCDNNYRLCYFLPWFSSCSAYPCSCSSIKSVSRIFLSSLSHLLVYFMPYCLWISWLLCDTTEWVMFWICNGGVLSAVCEEQHWPQRVCWRINETRQRAEVWHVWSFRDQAGIRTCFLTSSPGYQLKSHTGSPVSLINFCLLSITRFSFDISSFTNPLKICIFFFQTKLYLRVHLVALIDVLSTARDKMLPF